MFDLDRFIADLRATLPERSRQPMREVVARASHRPEGPWSGPTLLFSVPPLRLVAHRSPLR